MIRRTTALSLLTVLSVLAAACGQSVEPGTSPETTNPSVTTTSATAPEPTTSTTPPPTSTPASTTTTEADTSGTTLPGEPFDIVPAAGAELIVVGVEHDDVLNLRKLPGATQPVVSELAPTADGLIATGRGRRVGTTIWWELTVAGKTGWASVRYLAYEGDTTDETAGVIDRLGSPPETETMVDLGTLVAETLAGEDEEGSIRITLTVAPTVGDLGEITYDVLGLPDDSVGGFRVHVFGTPSPSGEGFILKTAEVTIFCSRGAGSDGLCV
jgi:hypothetical protein